MCARGYVCVCVCIHVSVCVSECVCACVCVCTKPSWDVLLIHRSQPIVLFAFLHLHVFYKSACIPTIRVLGLVFHTYQDCLDYQSIIIVLMLILIHSRQPIVCCPRLHLHVFHSHVFQDFSNDQSTRIVSFCYKVVCLLYALRA